MALGFGIVSGLAADYCTGDAVTWTADSGLTRTGGSNHIRCLFPAHKVTCSSSSGDNWETSSTGAFH